MRNLPGDGCWQITIGKVPTLLYTGVELGGEPGGRDSRRPVVVKECSILRNLGIGGDSFFGVVIPVE